MVKSMKIPGVMQEKYTAIKMLTDAFCDRFLSDEYRELIDCAIAGLSRKKPSPLLKGKENVWAAGIVHAIGTANFLFDKTQAVHCKSPDIYSFFDVASSTGQNKSKEIRDTLKINHFSAVWTLRSRVDKSPLLWMVMVNGMIVDIRNMPYEVQEMAFEKGMIPYIPENKI
jgi:hypothetical protein